MVKLNAVVALSSLEAGAQVQFGKCDEGCADMDLEAGTVHVRLKLMAPDGVTFVRFLDLGTLAMPAGPLAALRQALQTKCENLSGQAPGSSAWV